MARAGTATGIINTSKLRAMKYDEAMDQARQYKVTGGCRGKARQVCEE